MEHRALSCKISIEFPYILPTTTSKLEHTTFFIDSNQGYYAH
jgi:hypothetical protein